MQLNNFSLHIVTVFLGLSHSDEWLRELCDTHIYTPVKQEVVVDHLRVPGELKNVKHDWKYISVRFSRGANNCGTHVLEKNIYSISTFLFSFNNFTSMKR